MSIISQIINGLFDAIGGAIGFILGLLPDSPFLNMAPQFAAEEANILGWVNYFIPLSEMIVSFGLFLGVVVFHYGYRVAMSWIKMVSD